MKRESWPIVLVAGGCTTALLLLCFGSALFRGGQFGYRDAGHFYYPLYKRVQTEWEQGRWPLWEPEENSGMPLLGNPTAAVLYPFKVIYFLLPYAWAARVYTMFHAMLAFAAMLVLGRGWKMSWEGSVLAALTYAFGAPILFQYCNIIYLVGAAWLPLGFLTVDRWVREGCRPALLGLAVVLAMQVLGGDPQSAYLLGLCAAAYAVGLAWARARNRHTVTARHRAGPIEDTTGEPMSMRWVQRTWLILAGLVGLALWIALTLCLAELFHRLRPAGKPTPGLPWMDHVSRLVPLAWVTVVGIVLLRWGKSWWRTPLGATIRGLAGAAAVAAAMAGAQLLPVIEFTQQTARAAGEGPHDIYPFSIEPYRLAELIWPSVLGTNFCRSDYWIDALRLPGVHQKIWVPSLYLGSLGLILAFSALRLRHGSARQVWLSLILIVSLLGSLGPYTSPIWAARVMAQTTGLRVPDIGPLDSYDTTPIRQDGYLRDGDGSLYWWLTTVLPGLRQFRFPAKLFTFTSLAAAALAGIGWDVLRTRRQRATLGLAAGLLIVSLGLLGLVNARRAPLLQVLEARKAMSRFGPLDAVLAVGELTGSLVHGSVMMAVTLVVVSLAQRRPAAAGLLAVLAATADLGIANGRYVATVPQELFETEPEAVRILREAEQKNPSDGPFRVHRMAQWNPPKWFSTASDNRVLDFLIWERGTIQPKYGITEGIEYTHTMGVAELYDYEWYFAGFPRTIDEAVARPLGAQAGQQVIYYPRRGVDMWNTRYFILPEFPNGWMDENRGYAAFLHETDRIYPPQDRFQGPGPRRGGEAEARKEWIQNQDFQIRRNRQAYPRAWVAHESRGFPATKGLSRLEQGGPMQEILYAADPFWHDSGLPLYDPRRLVWIDRDERLGLEDYVAGQPPQPEETVKVSYPTPQRVEIEARLSVPGIVVLADVFYPGWKLTIDDKPAPIYCVNRAMRGAAVREGTHHLVYTYEPASFRVGRAISLGGLAAFLALAIVFTFRPRDPIIAAFFEHVRSPESAREQERSQDHGRERKQEHESGPEPI